MSLSYNLNLYRLSNKLNYVIFLLIIILNIFMINCCDYKNKAVVIVPVADLTTEPLQVVYKDSSNTEKYYNKMPFAEGKGYYSCMRVHQLLFNEIVNVIKEKNDEVLCQVPNIFFQTQSKIPINKFWTLKKNIKLIKDLKDKKYDISLIPSPYANNLQELLINSNTLTLVLPWTDPVTNISYSAGTRFERLKCKDKRDSYAIGILNYKNGNKHTAYVPKAKSTVTYSKNPSVCCRRFVNILKKWANQQPNFFPYVTGGCSILKTYKCNEFKKEQGHVNGNTVHYWNRPDKTYPKTGIDCSCLIARAAQIAGIPYYFKNTATIADFLDSLKKNQTLEDGDIIWYKGHVLIISDIKNNKVLESTGYPFGYGLVHEKPLNCIFKDINTYKDLLNKYFNKKGIKRLNSKKEVARDIPEFKILKMKSTWNKNIKK